MMSGDVNKLRGSRANFVQNVLSFGFSLAILYVGVFDDPDANFQVQIILSSMFMVFALINASNQMRNRHTADLLESLAGPPVTKEITAIIRGTFGITALNYLVSIGAFVTALSYVSVAKDGYHHLTSAVIFLAMSSINVAKTVRDYFDAENLQSARDPIRSIVKDLSVGTVMYGLVNTVCAIFSFVVSVVHIAKDSDMSGESRFAAIVCITFMVVCSVNMSKLVRDDREANSLAWKLMTIAAFIASVGASFGGPTAMHLSHDSLLFVETNNLWILSSTLTCSKILRDIHEARTARAAAVPSAHQ